MKEFKEIKVVTHNRKFHLDEVFANALLLVFLKTDARLVTYRTRDLAEIENFQNDENVFVIDVGLQYDEKKLNFDHHQKNFNERWEDGTLMSSCGLVWKYLKDNNHLTQHMDKEMVTVFEESFIKKIDNHDNGVEFVKDLDFILMYNRNHHDNAVMDKQYISALLVARDYLHNLMAKFKADRRANKDFNNVLNSFKDKKYIIFDNNNRSYVDMLKEYEFDYYAMPHSAGKFLVKALNNKAMPKEMHGKSDFEMNGFKFDFCHKNGFMCVIKTNQDKLKQFLDILELIN